ncbi:MAG: helix-turn-helix domain-containing protein [Butyrivibrio sp.]|nr:helix-turn-helix domain-containing protein [Butyrivibrio sp.]
MEIIVIDDDMPTVEVILKSVDWKKFNIDTTYSAYNISGAQKIFLENNISIAICDIEMPMGSGLDLLKWVREKGFDTEFIFLTSHEKFDYAKQAIQYNASGYVVKPFNVERMEAELVTALQKLHDRAEIQKASLYEEWYSDNLEYVETVFWNDILKGRIATDLSTIDAEIKNKRLNIDVNAMYGIILLAGSNINQLTEDYGHESVGAFEKKLSELSATKITGGSGINRCISYQSKNIPFTAMILDASIISKNDINEKLETLIDEVLEVYKVTITAYISNLYSIDKLGSACQHLEELDKNNVASKGKVFFEDDVIVMASDQEHILNQDQIRLLLNEKKKKELLNLLKFSMESLAAKKKLDAVALKDIKQDLLQTVYVYLYGKEIQATQLFGNEAAISLDERAGDSLMDMIRWQVYLISQTIDYVSEVEQSNSIVSRAKAFVHEHYKEEISRTEVAASVYLTPEYMAKMFKKETGISIKQYITDYRVSKAKELLSNPDIRISDVATDVGFDNFSYFSTVFKKTTGYTPNEYHAMTMGETF